MPVLLRSGSAMPGLAAFVLVSSTIGDSIGAGHEPCETVPRMGFNPNRPQKRRPSDVIFVAAGLAVAVLLVLWAFLG